MTNTELNCSHPASHLTAQEILRESAHGLNLRLGIVGDSTVPCYAREGDAIRQELARRVGRAS